MDLKIKRPKRVLSVQIDSTLFEEIKTEIEETKTHKNGRLTWNAVVDFGLREFLKQWRGEKKK